MARVYITIDTEYCSGFAGDLSQGARADAFVRSFAGAGGADGAGVPYQLQRLKETGQKAVFFVDPMPALIWGTAAIGDMAGPILEAGQDVQLHLHTEWLALAGDRSPLPSKRTGVNLFEFPLADQRILLAYAREQLIAAGAPPPVAFRAGNYGANDDTLRAAAELGIIYDTSHCPALPGASRITLGPEIREPLEHCGLIEVPVGSIGALGAPGKSHNQRHGQITALTLAEMRAAIRHARDIGSGSLTLVSHSFELFNRRTLRANRLVRRRFDALCAFLRDEPGVVGATYRDHPPQVAAGPSAPPLAPSVWRTGVRYAEQAISNTLYGAM
ncbi:MAG: hypothetical protein AAF559_06425 [Pseudomonadota bacterium]